MPFPEKVMKLHTFVPVCEYYVGSTDSITARQEEGSEVVRGKHGLVGV